MKKFAILFIIFILTMVFVGCSSEPVPEIENPEPAPEISEHAEEITDIYTYLKSKTGSELYIEFIESGHLSGFLRSTWDDPRIFSPDCFTFYYELTEISRIAAEDTEAGKDVPEIMEISEEQVESYVMKYFDVTAEYIRGAQNYDPEKKIYSFSTLGGFGGGPGYNVSEVEALGGDLYVFRCDCGEESPEKADITLEIKELGSYRYVSCLYDDGTEKPTSAEFAFDTEGEVKTLSNGDEIGEWTLGGLGINLDHVSGEVYRADGVFSGSVVLEGKIIRDPMLEMGYDLVVNDEDKAKIPHYVSPDGICDGNTFRLEIPKDIENYPSLDFGEELKVRVTVSEYRFVFAYMGVGDRMFITKIELI